MHAPISTYVLSIYLRSEVCKDMSHTVAVVDFSGSKMCLDGYMCVRNENIKNCLPSLSLSPNGVSLTWRVQIYSASDMVNTQDTRKV